MNKEELNKILEDHKLWLDDNTTGKRADLMGANLNGADLSEANLRWVNLEGANLEYTDLPDATITREKKITHSYQQVIVNLLTEVMDDTMQVFDFGTAKHPDSGDTPNFMTENGNKCSLHERGSSILRHAARTFMNPGLLDSESELPELLHLIASASILYIRAKHCIIHPNDKKLLGLKGA